jgi:hypothetical protein
MPDTAASDRPDTQSASQDNPMPAYWASRIAHDRLYYSDYVQPGEHFVAPNTEMHVYRLIDIHHGGDLFTLEPCVRRDGGAANVDTPVTGANYVDNICKLGGALEAGDLVHLPDGVLRNVGDYTYLSHGDIVMEFPAGMAPERDAAAPMDTPNGPPVATVAEYGSDTADGDTSPVVYLPGDAVTQPPTSSSAGPDADDGTPADFIPVQQFSRWTFEDDTIREWVERQFAPGDRILNACAGETRLTPPPGGDIVRNDKSSDRPADLHVDVAELAAHFDENTFDVVVFDPPWSLYQSNLRYDGVHVTKNDAETMVDLTALPFETPSAEEKSQIGHARLAKENFDWLLRPHGRVVQLTFHGTAMPARLGYDRQERVIFDPIGEAKAVIGSVDRNQPEGDPSADGTTPTGNHPPAEHQSLTAFEQAGEN